MKTLALELPVVSACTETFLCKTFCRVGGGGKGDLVRFENTVKKIDFFEYDRVYLTANGLTHNSPVFSSIVEKFSSCECEIGILNPILPHNHHLLSWFEVSLNPFPNNRWLKVLQENRARFHGTLIASIVDNGFVQIESLLQSCDGVMMRQLRAEGNSKDQLGETKLILNKGVDFNPVSCYSELSEIGTCDIAINSFGQKVNFFGNFN